MKIQQIAVEDLIPYDRNPRINGKAVDAVAESIRQFGFRQPIVVDPGRVIICGHTRWEASRRLGLKKVPVHVAEDLSHNQVRALRIADNKTAELASWDLELLPVELRALSEIEFDLSGLGFAEKELAKLLQMDLKAGDTDSDAIPDPPASPLTQPGDLWLLGEHRLLCGDATSQQDVARVSEDGRADVVFTDPPYGVNIQGGKQNKSIAGDLTQTAIPFAFDLACSVASHDDARLYFCGGEGNIGLYAKLFEKYCRQLPRHLIWVKNGFVMKPNGYHNGYEIIFFGFKSGGGSLKSWFAGRTESEASDVWRISRDAPGHYARPTQKPVELPARAIRNSCPPGGVVYDPFAGSGSTLMACESTGRRCRAMEIEPKYCDVIVRRWEEFTGRKADRELGKELVDTRPSATRKRRTAAPKRKPAKSSK